MIKPNAKWLGSSFDFPGPSAGRPILSGHDKVVAGKINGDEMHGLNSRLRGGGSSSLSQRQLAVGHVAPLRDGRPALASRLIAFALVDFRLGQDVH